MILSDRGIKTLLEAGRLKIEPLGPQQLQPASVDCTLGDHFLIMEHHTMDSITLDQPIEYRSVTAQEFSIPAHSFVLATTNEYLQLPDNLTAFVEGRSSIGRLGLFIQNAGWVDPGFAGKITLELYNANPLPIKLTAGRRICQLVFCQLDQTAEHPYRGKYQGQREAVGSRIFADAEVENHHNHDQTARF